MDEKTPEQIVSMAADYLEKGITLIKSTDHSGMFFDGGIGTMPPEACANATILVGALGKTPEYLANGFYGSAMLSEAFPELETTYVSDEQGDRLSLWQFINDTFENDRRTREQIVEILRTAKLDPDFVAPEDAGEMDDYSESEWDDDYPDDDEDDYIEDDYYDDYFWGDDDMDGDSYPDTDDYDY